jgi:hypothetical protein
MVEREPRLEAALADIDRAVDSPIVWTGMLFATANIDNLMTTPSARARLSTRQLKQAENTPLKIRAN